MHKLLFVILYKSMQALTLILLMTLEGPVYMLQLLEGESRTAAHFASYSL